MIKEVYFTQMEVVHDRGYRLLKITAMGDNTIRINMNKDALWTREEFDECIPVIRSAFDVLVKNIELEIGCEEQNGGG